MKIGFIASNYVSINHKTQKGTEIFSYSLIKSLAKVAKNLNLDITVFASGDSELPVKIESIDLLPSIAYKNVDDFNKHFIFELALIGKALSQQDEFDLYHYNIGDGDLIMPFAQFVTKPILITSHGSIDEDFTRKYFDLFSHLPKVYFISISDSQRKVLPHVRYIATIHHGIEANVFGFNPHGEDNIMWAGRMLPYKGPDAVIEIAEAVKRPTQLFGIPKPEAQEWFETYIKPKIAASSLINLTITKGRYDLIEEYQKSKVFLFPITWEEAFGLVVIESMSCGTPVVAYARGAMPELIKDGETGFLVNESESDIRGNYIIKKTGIEGLKEAVERIYAMSADEYRTMRLACRQHVEQNFTIEKMTQQYIEVYKKVIDLSKDS